MITITEIRETLISDLMELGRIELEKDPEIIRLTNKLDKLYVVFKNQLKQNKKTYRIFFEIQDLETNIGLITERHLYEKGLLMGTKIEELLEVASNGSVSQA